MRKPLITTIFTVIAANVVRPVNSLESFNIAYPQLFRSRAENGKALLRVTDTMTLSLAKSTVLHPDFFLRTFRAGTVPQHTYFNTDVLEEELYHDEQAMASVLVSEREGGVLRVEGLLGPNLRIKPLKSSQRALNGPIPHVMEVIEDGDHDDPSRYGALETGINVTLSSRQDPYTQNPNVKIYPEILVICDSTFRGQFTSLRKLLYYILIVVNAINLRYRTVTEPEVKIKLRALEIKTYYNEEFILRVSEDYKAIDSLKSLAELRNHVLRDPATYVDYDMVYAITGLDMVTHRGSRVERSIAGLAYVASACGDYKVALGEDAAGTFKGVRIMAHELGHVLGCPHDGQTNAGYANFAPDSRNCPWSDGFIMSYVQANSRSMKFSSCCNKQINMLARAPQGWCLRRLTVRRRIKRKRKTPRLPGEITNRDRQCRNAYPTLRTTRYLPEFGEQNCKISCSVPEEVYQRSGIRWPAFLNDGTPCHGRRDMVCINGDCIQKRHKYPAMRIT
ncbi:venom metalloproteinase antarease TserMP_A-like [Haemaphysalis longicornis]